MGIGSFFFNGSVPPSLTTTATNTPVLPQWYQDTAKQVLAQGTALSQQPFQPYTDQVVAPLSPLQNEAAQLAQNQVGQQTPLLNSATGMYNQVGGGPSPLEQGAAGLYGASPGAANPAVSNAENIYDKIGAGGNLDPLMASIASLGTRNLQENLLPAVQDTAIGGGQFGGSRQTEFAERATRDTGQNILNAQAQALLQGQQNQLAAAQGLTGAGLGYGQLLQGAGAGLSNLGLGIGSQELGAAQGLTNTAQTGQNIGEQQAAALDAAGQEQQQNQQNQLNFNYQQFQQGKQWPYQNLQFLGNLLGVTQPPAQTTQQQTAPYQGPYRPSPFQNILGTAATVGGIAALFSSKTYKNRKGRVHGKSILTKMAELPVDRWSYKWDAATPHIGTYAEDFQKSFGVGDGKTIPVVDAIGILTAAVKELSKQSVRERR